MPSVNLPERVRDACAREPEKRTVFDALRKLGTPFFRTYSEFYGPVDHRIGLVTAIQALPA